MKNFSKINFISWLIGAAIAVGLITFIMFKPFKPITYCNIVYSAFLGRVLYIIIVTSAMSLYRIAKGPTSADRIVAIDILGIMIIGLCAVLTIVTGRSWYIDIGIAWALQSFISTLALSKHLEGKGFDE